MTATFVMSMLPASLVNEMDPEATAKFPNYLYIYFVQLVVPVAIGALFNVLYYHRNAALRKAVASQLKMFFNQ